MSSDRNDGISIACGIRKTVVRYHYLIRVVGGRCSLRREESGQRNWQDSWERRIASSKSTALTLIVREEGSSSIKYICMSLCS